MLHCFDNWQFTVRPCLVSVVFVFVTLFELNPKYTKCNRTICWTLLKEKVIFKFYYIKKWDVYMLLFLFFPFVLYFQWRRTSMGKGSFLQEPGKLLSPQLDSPALPFNSSLDLIQGWICIFHPRKRSHHQDAILRCTPSCQVLIQ